MTGLRRWGGYVALVVAFALACGLLSWWQWARRAEAVAEIERVAANYDAPAVALDAVLGDVGDVDEESEWRPVVLTGEYLARDELLVRNRPRGGQAGFEVLVPFRLADGRVFVVDRGWLPGGSTAAGPDAVPRPPTGEVEVIVRLKPGEPEIPGRSAPEGQIATIHLPEIARLVDAPTYTGMYGLLAEESPSTLDRPLPAIKPEADEGPHLSYALQWIAFGILAFIGLVWAIRRERRIAALPESERAAARAPRRGHRDADEEDALLDRARSPIE